MAITELNKLMKIARLQAGKSLVDQAEEMKVTPSFIISMEKGRKKISEDWKLRILKYFTELDVDLPDFDRLVLENNRMIELDKLPDEGGSLVARLAICFTSSDMSREHKEQVAALLDQIEKEQKGVRNARKHAKSK